MKLLRTLSGVVLLCALLLAFNTALASARPTSGADESKPAQLVSWRQLGQSEKLVIIGSNLPNGVELPVPAGVKALSLTGTVGSVVNVAGGRVDVLDSRGVQLGAIPLPPGTTSAPFVIDTSAATVTNGTVGLTFVLREDNPPGTSCSTPPSVTLGALAMSFSGPSPDPVTVSDFRPGYLSRFVLWVGPNAPRDVQQAALTLTAQLSALYRPIPVRIDVDTADNPQPVQPSDTRLIEIRRGPQPGMTVRNGGTPAAALVITGQDASLENQIGIFVDRRIDLAQSPSAAVTSVADNVRPSARTLTFAQLGMAVKTTVLGTSTLYSGFDATTFGVGPIQGAQLHLVARYTPVVGGEGSVVLQSGSTVLATRTLDSSGILDLQTDIPAELIASKTGMALEIQYLPRQECAPLSDRLTFVLDPASTVTVIPGAANRGGFPGMPMSLTPDFAVALGDPTMIRYAAQAINLMGQTTDTPLRPTVRSLDDALKGDQPLMLVTNQQQLSQSGLKPPIQPGTGASVSINGDPVTAVDLNGALGVIQAFTDRNRAVLAIDATGDWSLVDRSFDYIRSQDDGWSSLSGDVVATGAKNVTVNLTLREGGPMAPQPAASSGWRWWVWLTAGVSAAAIVAVTLFLLGRRRHSDST
ncbi:hypothetical protein BayCH28_06875 [Mycolicibacterium sp. CH28]|uniref:hypothetical protein n=1 Tax=Mycolicibacterium sp. CH28 TaxID=2512237 RepID=UPI0010812BC7|nr:hypothetical protein [Mycolicibacterium sp. CH28]TGD89086.1 hypothetical protein BayCH28_06875 [Mycolicibacterium sp. CH28]